MSVGESLDFHGIHFSRRYGIVHMDIHRYLYRLVGRRSKVY